MWLQQDSKQFTDKYEKWLLLFTELNPATFLRREMKIPIFIGKVHNHKGR